MTIPQRHSCSPSPSIRLDRLTNVLDKVLTASRTQLDTSRVIGACYGGDSDAQENQVLQDLLERMLDQVHDHVRTSMKEYLKEQGVQERLSQVEFLLAQLSKEERLLEQMEALDKESARLAASSAATTAVKDQQVSARDMINHRAYQTMLAEKESLLKQVTHIEEEIASLEEEQKLYSRQVQTHVDELQAAGRVLEQSADRCSNIRQ